LVTSADTTYGGGAAPSQNQYLELDGYSTSIQQSINLATGTYSITFYGRARPGYSPALSISVYVNGARIYGTNMTTTWTQYKVTNFVVTKNITTIMISNDTPKNLIYYANEIDDITLTKGKESLHIQFYYN
jgi:hypothetical protein